MRSRDRNRDTKKYQTPIKNIEMQVFFDSDAVFEKKMRFFGSSENGGHHQKHGDGVWLIFTPLRWPSERGSEKTYSLF